MHARSLSHVGLFANPCTVACQALLSMGFSRQAYWSGLPFPPPEDLPNQESNLCLLKFLHWQVDSFYHWATQKVPREWVRCKEINFHGFLMLWIRRMQRFLINPGSPDASEPLRTRVLKDFSKTKVAAIEGHLQFLIPGEGLDIKLATLCCVLGCFTVRLLCPWESPVKNTGVFSNFLLQGIFPTQGSNQRLLWFLHWQADSFLLVLPATLKVHK